MSAKIQWEGLNEFRQALKKLPQELTGEGGNIVEASANGAAVEIKRGYPSRTGNLRKGVVVTHFDKGKFSAGAIVKNTAKHANIFEVGTQARHTAIGANRGSMPPGRVFVPTVIKWRRRMFNELKAMLERHGLLVSGNG